LPQRLDCCRSGIDRVNFRLWSGTAGESVNARIYKNGSPGGSTEFLAPTTTKIECSEDISVTAGDYISIWAKKNSSSTAYPQIDGFALFIAEVI
jgi:hypothetical protein